MRRVILEPGEVFSNKHLKRTGAFNAAALTAATAIIEDVRERGDGALRDYTERFDGVRLEDFRVPQLAVDEAAAYVDDGTARALRQAASQIRDFHERQRQQSWFTVREDGALVGSKVEPLESVGIYVPGGRALYPSTVLMNALPAAVAGVPRIVCVTPPAKSGMLDPAILYACRLAGVTEIYAVGGAQAVAALAYGTESIEPVAKITGPGNAYVAAAKKVVSGDVGIDMIAGPSEVCVVADATADPALVAIDLMARYASPLSVDEFVKKSSVIQYSPAALARDADAVTTIARHEGLWAHAMSVEMRRNLLRTGNVFGEEGGPAGAASGAGAVGSGGADA